jgi:UDP-glucuronate decarboxylase
MDTPDDVVGPINLGNPSEFTMLQLAEKIITLTGSRSRIEYHPLPTDDPKQRQPDITKARSILGWEPKTELAVGLVNTIHYFDGLLKSGVIANPHQPAP